MKLDLNKLILNTSSSYFYYSILLLPTFINIFKIQVNFLFLLVLGIFSLNKENLFNFKKIDFFPILIELIVITYSFYFVPKTIKYILFTLIIFKICFEVLSKKIKLILRINTEQKLIIILLSIYPLLNTFINDIFIYKDFSTIGYIRIFRTLLIIIIGLYAFSKYKNLNMIIRPIFVSGVMHAVINIGYLLNLTNTNYLLDFSMIKNYTFRLYDPNEFGLGFFSSNVLL